MKKNAVRVPVCAIAVVWSAFGVAVGCGNGAGDDDAGSDASLDATLDVKTDAAKDGGADAKADVGVDASDAGTDASDASDASDDVADASDASDASDDAMDAGLDAAFDGGIACGMKTNFGFVNGGDGGGCGTGAMYSCGVDQFEIVCECPSAACTCTKNGNDAGSVPYGGCPLCSTPSFGAIATSCGIPY